MPKKNLSLLKRVLMSIGDKRTNYANHTKQENQSSTGEPGSNAANVLLQIRRVGRKHAIMAFAGMRAVYDFKNTSMLA